MSDSLTLGRNSAVVGEEDFNAPLHVRSLGEYGPLGFDAGDANLYRYVGNDPTDETDPTGLAESDPTDRSGYYDPSRYKPINLYIDSTTMPADFNLLGVQGLLQQILNDAGVQATVNLIPTTAGFGGLSGSGLLGPKYGPDPNHGLQEAPLLGFGFFTTFVSPKRPSYIGQTIDGVRCNINLTSIGAYKPKKPAKNRDVLYANILFHESLYHGFYGNFHIPFVNFESTPFGQSRADIHDLTKLTPDEAKMLQDQLHPEDRFPTGLPEFPFAR